ncbi:MAG: N-acetyltransferase [Dehalococcoidales bacterium]
MLTIRYETSGDYEGIRQINRKAFSRENEAELVDRLRNHNAAAVSLVAEMNGELVGHALFSTVTFQPECPALNAVTLAPLSVIPAYQRQGIGSQLMETGIKECRKKGYGMIFLVGHADYYPRFGFSSAGNKGFKCEYEAPDEAWMVLEVNEVPQYPKNAIVHFNQQFKYVV